MVGSSSELPGRSHKRFGGCIERIGSEHQVGFVIGKEFEHCCLNAAICKPVPQAIRRQSGQRQQPLGTAVVRQRPAKRFKRQNLGRP